MHSNKDIDDRLKPFDANGRRDVMGRLLADACDFLTWKIICIGRLPGGLEHKVKSLREQKIFGEIQDASPINKKVYVDKIVNNIIELEPDDIFDELKRAAGESLEKRINEVAEGVEKLGPIIWKLQSYIICEFFSEKGKFFISEVENIGYIFFHNRIYEIGSNVDFKALMNRLAGLNYTQPQAKFIFEELLYHCHNYGAVVKTSSWIHTDTDKDIVYINLRSPDYTILKIGNGEVEVIPNGMNEDGILLNSPEQMLPFKFLPDVDIEKSMGLMRQLFTKNFTCDPDDRFFVLCWALSTFFVDFTSAHLHMHLNGSKESGKSTAAKFIYYLLYGLDMPGKSTMAADFSFGANELLIVKDDLEKKNRSCAVEETLRVIATGGGRIKRKGGTDRGVVIEMVKALFIITAIDEIDEPALLSRTAVVRFKERHKRTDFFEGDDIKAIKKHRNELLSAFFLCMAREILPVLGEKRDVIVKIRKDRAKHSKNRMDEQLSIIVLINRVFMKYLQPYGPLLEPKQAAEDMVLKWIDGQNRNTKAIAKDSCDALFYLNSFTDVYWASFQRKEKTFPEQRNFETIEKYGIKMELVTEQKEGKDITYLEFNCICSVLVTALNVFGKDMGKPFPFGTNVRQFAVHLRNEKELLTSAGWTFSNGKKIQGYSFYNFKRIFDTETVII